MSIPRNPFLKHKKAQDTHAQSLGMTVGQLVFAIIFFFVGTFVGVQFLMFEPASTVSEIPQTKRPGVLYFLKTTESLAKAPYWKAKRRALYDDNSEHFSVPLSDAELNAWSSRTLQKEYKAIRSSGDTVSTPNKVRSQASLKRQIVRFTRSSYPYFRIDDSNNTLHVAQRLELYIGGMYMPFIAQIEGRFEESRNGYHFNPMKITLGSAELSSSFGIPDIIAYQLILPLFKDLPEFNNVANMWDQIAYMEIADGQLLIEKKRPE